MQSNGVHFGLAIKTKNMYPQISLSNLVGDICFTLSTS